MTTRLLIAVQLLVLPIWPGLCTCSRSMPTETSVSTCDCGCACCSPEHQSAGKPKQPCKAPGCPAEVTLVRADPGMPTIPVAVPAPAAPTIDRPATVSRASRSGQFDSTNSVPTHIFLACSVLLI